MTALRETLVLAGLCLFVAVVSLGATVWAVVQAASAGVLLGEILTLDGLLLISVGLLISLMFGLCFLWLAYDARLWERLKSRKLGTSEGSNPGPNAPLPPGS